MTFQRTILLGIGIAVLCVIFQHVGALHEVTHDMNGNAQHHSQKDVGAKTQHSDVSPPNDGRRSWHMDSSPLGNPDNNPSHDHPEESPTEPSPSEVAETVDLDNRNANPETHFPHENHTRTTQQQSNWDMENSTGTSPRNNQEPEDDDDDDRHESTTSYQDIVQIGDVNNPSANPVNQSSSDSQESRTGTPQQNHSQGQGQQHSRTNEANISSSHSAPQQNIIRIVVMGRSGSGVSSTIRELIGNATTCEKPNGTENLQNIYEYTISNIRGTNNWQIKLVDIPGFIDGRTLEQESQILATLKSYYADQSSPPDFYLVLSRFDDNRIVGVHSLFVQLLKRIELFKNEFVDKLPPDNKMNIIFLLTRLMSETKSNQRKPTDKINTFRRVIEEFSSLPPPHPIVVGDNNAQTEYNARVEQGYYRLPNKEHYPKNIWDAMINSTQFESDAPSMEVHSVLHAIKDNREIGMKCEARLFQTNWDEYSSDADAFLYFLQQQVGWSISETEVNLKIDEVFNHYPDSDKPDGIIQKTALQLYLQNANVSTIQEDIPTSYVDRAAFFQKSSLISSSYPALLLNEAFGLEMPEYIKPLTVGYCYDVLADELSLESPFKITKALPSSIGYTVPNFMKCRKFQSPDFQMFKSYSQNMSDYFHERLKYLKFESGEDIINPSNFTGRAKDGFNIAPAEGDEIAALSAAKEYRTLKCILSEKEYWGELNEEFVENINSLQPIVVHKRDSITEWKGFFGKYGTHIVTEGYGGGKLLGSIVGTNVKKAFESRSTIDATLESILKFSTFSVPDLEQPSYGLFGGEVAEENNQISQLYNLPEAQRDQLLREWGESLNSNFDMLKTEFTLDRISIVVKEKMGLEKGEMVDQAIELLLRGELEFKRKGTKGNATTGGRKNKNRDSPRNSPRPPKPTKASINSHYGDTPTNYGDYQDGGHVPPPTPTYPTQGPRPVFNNGAGDDRTGSSPSSFDYQNRTNLSGLLTSQIQTTNFTLGVMEQSLESKRRTDEERHRVQQEFYRRHYQDKLVDLEQRKNESLLNVQKTNETAYIRHQHELNLINEQIKEGRRQTESQIEYLQRMEELAELKHQYFLKELERQDKEQRKKNSRCSGLKILSPSCWG